MPLEDGSNGECAGKIRPTTRSKLALQNEMVAILLRKLLFQLTMKNANRKISFCAVDRQSYLGRYFSSDLGRDEQLLKFAASFLGNAK
jgi:hypothetical protein